jgi:hypothetical protein
MKKKFFRWVIKWFIIKLNLYLLWSRLHQKLFQKKRLAIPKHASLKELEQTLSTSKWTADTWKELWDVVNHPEHAYWKLKNQGTLGDCDDHAVLAAEVIDRDLWPGDPNALVLSVQWLNKEGKFKGHNVCVFVGEFDDTTEFFTAPQEDYGTLDNGKKVALGWIGNYFGGRARIGYRDISGIVAAIVGEGQLISWFTFDNRCKHIGVYTIPKD